nr:MAG TPA: hypothetical protein [Bacteriophage sp.]
MKLFINSIRNIYFLSSNKKRTTYTVALLLIFESLQ